MSLTDTHPHIYIYPYPYTHLYECVCESQFPVNGGNGQPVGLAADETIALALKQSYGA